MARKSVSVICHSCGGVRAVYYRPPSRTCRACWRAGMAAARAVREQLELAQAERRRRAEVDGVLPGQLVIPGVAA